MGLSPVRLITLFCLCAVFGFVLPGCDQAAVESTALPGPHAGFDDSVAFFKPATDVADGPTQLVYVPVYSRVYLSKASVSEMATSLSIRNTDPDQALVVHEVDYFDTAGKLLERYLETPHRLDPMSTATLTLPQWDKRGGTGANFLVRWSGDADINAPIIEVVTIGTRGEQSFSFSRVGQAIVE